MRIRRVTFSGFVGLSYVMIEATIKELRRHGRRRRLATEIVPPVRTVRPVERVLAVRRGVL